MREKKRKERRERGKAKEGQGQQGAEGVPVSGPAELSTELDFAGWIKTVYRICT